MKKINVTVALLLVFSMFFAACGQDGTGDVSSEDRTLRLSTRAPMTTSDPHGTINIEDLMVMRQVYEPLFRQNELTGEFVPLVATDHAISGDGTVYTFTIRQGVKFHNGDELTAEDVEFSLQRAMNSPRVRSYMAGVADVRAEGDGTVIVTLDQPNAALLSNLAFVFIVNKREVTEQGEEFGTKLNLAGTGPFRFTYLVHDIEWRLEAFPDYHQGEADIKNIHYVPIADLAAALIAFESGSLDWLIAPIANWDGLVANPAFNTELSIGNHISYAVLNHLNPPLDDINVRLAIAHAIDKQAMNLIAFDGLAENANFMVHPDKNVGAPSEGVTYNLDLDKAREYLAKSAYPNGTHVGTINVSAGGYFERMAQVLQDNLMAIGLTSDINRMDSASNLERGRNQQFDIMTTGFSPNGDFDSWKMYCHTDFRGTFYNQYEGDVFDWEHMNYLWAKGVSVADVAEREAIYRELNDWIMGTATQLPIFHRAGAYVWTAALNVPVNYPNYPIVYEWSWK
ncbi:MAG: ABC transporter substrate-binding protein [Defluviitaleaceae bacterium]|nr:ABC transporter substrate-binding protein [Defluviitaleaceae bacterium]MCL2836700.1 ABC transporter substrate-binding protein [Defluviitaleaceae bacterium]